MYRIRDIVLSVLLLLGSSWLLLVIVILLKITQEEVFFRQKRTGFQGKPFEMIKFSTLRDLQGDEKVGVDEHLRLTALGKWLRRLSLDELPQLWHVLKGEMSLVGPRPLRHEYLSLYSLEQKRRFEVRPGITGWAQIKGRNALSFTERFELDVWYVDHRSLWLDLKILFQTPFAAFRGRGVTTEEERLMEPFDGTN